MDFSEEPEPADLDYIEEYPDIFDFEQTDDDILEVENIIEDETPKEISEKDVEEDKNAKTRESDI